MSVPINVFIRGFVPIRRWCAVWPSTDPLAFFIAKHSLTTIDNSATDSTGRPCCLRSTRTRTISSFIWYPCFSKKPCIQCASVGVAFNSIEYSFAMSKVHDPSKSPARSNQKTQGGPHRTIHSSSNAATISSLVLPLISFPGRGQRAHCRKPSCHRRATSRK